MENRKTTLASRKKVGLNFGENRTLHESTQMGPCNRSVVAALLLYRLRDIVMASSVGGDPSSL